MRQGGLNGGKHGLDEPNTHAGNNQKDKQRSFQTCRSLRMNRVFKSANSVSKKAETCWTNACLEDQTGWKPAETQRKVRVRDCWETHQTRSRSGRFGAAGRSKAHKLDISTHADPPLPKMDTFLRLSDKTFALLFIQLKFEAASK